MEEVRQLVQEEGREARNLVAFHVAVDTPIRVSRKPPRAAPPPRRTPPRASRLRSASAGRDKRSELRARYWALLFGDLQRAVGEIYNTVEAHENLNECQEVILVLENYTRDFRALGEWFRLKWEYDNTPPPQRPQSLAWEIRKTDFVRPESRRAHSVKSSPSVSGKNSPCMSGHNTPSGKNSPNLTGKASPGSGKISPRIASSTSPKANIEFFTNKVVASKITTKPEPKSTKEPTRLSDIKEKDVRDTNEQHLDNSEEINLNDSKQAENSKMEKDSQENIKPPVTVEIKKPKEMPTVTSKPDVIKSLKSIKPNSENNKTSDVGLSSQAINTISQLEAMENELLMKQLSTVKIKNENFLNEEKEIETNKMSQENFGSKTSLTDDIDSVPTVSPTKSEENFADVSNENSPKLSTGKSIKPSTQLVEKNALNDKKAKKINGIKNDNETTKIAPCLVIENVPEVNITLDVVTSEVNNKAEMETITPDVSSVINITKENQDGKITKTSKVTDSTKNITTKTRSTKQNQKVIVNSSVINQKMTEVKKEMVIENGVIDHNSEDLEEKLNKENVKVKKDITYDNRTNELKDLNKDSERPNSDITEEPKKELCTKVTDSKPTVESKTNTKPAYSQAAAKPKPLNATKMESKTPTRTALVRSSTVVEMRPTTGQKLQRPFQKRNQTNKCSYPFNLTTSRTSLFDTPASSNANNKAPFVKRLPNKNIHMPAGDAKAVPNKVDNKKRPQRPTALKITGKGDKKENTDPPLDKLKDDDDYGSSDTIVTQIDMSRIESSESLKTLVPDDPQLNDIANSIEVLNVDNSENDNEGWLTVKSRRLSRESKKQLKSHWANRFNQPSATTSLPTLNMLESPNEEPTPIVESPKVTKIDRAKSEQPQLTVKPEVVEEVAKVPTTPKVDDKPKDPAMIRQKSDVTGLKTKSSKSKVLTKRAGKIKDTSKDDEQSELTILIKNRLHSSLESLTTGLERSQESTEDPFDFDKWKEEFRSTFKYLDDDDQISDHKEILKTADPTEMSVIAEMTSQIEENERKISWALDFQSEVDQLKLCEEEDLLNRQIMELQQVSDVDLDTETDDTETDAEILCEDTSNAASSPSETLGSLAASLEDQYETALAGMSWAERVDALVALEALVARDPGRAQQLHAKLSQGIKRRGSLQDALRRLQAKQARAERQRIEYQTERAKKIHQLLARVAEVKVAKNQLIEEKRLRMEVRLQRAAENRDQYLKDIVKKAHDEDEKLREIAFIKQLEAQNRRHDFLAHCRYHTTRLRQMRRDRLRKLEEKAAREAAVGARRQAIEEARRKRVESMMQRRRLRDERVQGLRELRRQERGDAAREKAEGVKSRLSALAAAAKLEAVALRSRIRDKQDASQQRLEQHLQAVREKATGPRQANTSESHEQPSNEDLELERREREKQKIIKRKARKLRLRLLNSGQAAASEDRSHLNFDLLSGPFVHKIQRAIQQINNILTPLCDEPPVAQKPNQNQTNGLDSEEKPKKHKNKKAINGDAGHDENKSNEDKDKPVNGVENNNNEFEIPEEKVENKKKKKKNKGADNGNDKEKLSKASSVCSSLSDTSRSSKKVEANVHQNVTFDQVQLERHLNELCRMEEKNDTFVSDRKPSASLTAQKIYCLRVIGKMLALASEREDLAVQFTTKSLCTAVALVSRAAGSSQAVARFLITSNIVVHLVSLLQITLEKDLLIESRETELARHISDCLSVSLDLVLCFTRLHEDGDQKANELGALRNRAHLIISYLCLTGCFTRSEAAGHARQSVLTLLTLCADLCEPSTTDIGSERASAKQALRYALGTSIYGSRAEFCMLFAEGADLGHCSTFVKAARTTHLLRALAEMDHLIVQEAFGEDGWPLEFRAAVSRLLSQHAPSDKEAPRSPSHRKGFNKQRLDESLSETMVLDLIALVGFVVVNNPQLQEMICDGWTVVKMLCTLPANWLVSSSHCHVLLPTLVALAEHPGTATVIESEFSVEMLFEYMQGPNAQTVKLVQVIKQGRKARQEAKNKNKSTDNKQLT